MQKANRSPRYASVEILAEKMTESRLNVVSKSTQAGQGARSVLVLGLGNLLNSDEGLGVHAVRALQADRAADFPQVTFLDGGTLGLNLLPLVEDSSALLLLDCVDAGLEPGSVIELAGDEIPRYSGVKLSQHQTTFQEVLGLAEIRGALPARLHLIGVQPASLALGTELSPQVQACLPGVLQRVEALLQGWISGEGVR
jgi:hydrogenase maturation protease